MKRVEDLKLAVVLDIDEQDMHAVYHSLEREDNYWMELTLSSYEMSLVLAEIDQNPDRFTQGFIEFILPVLHNNTIGALYLEMKEG